MKLLGPDCTTTAANLRHQIRHGGTPIGFAHIVKADAYAGFVRGRDLLAVSTCALVGPALGQPLPTGASLAAGMTRRGGLFGAATSLAAKKVKAGLCSLTDNLAYASCFGLTFSTMPLLAAAGSRSRMGMLGALPLAAVAMLLTQALTTVYCAVVVASWAACCTAALVASLALLALRGVASLTQLAGGSAGAVVGSLVGLGEGSMRTLANLCDFTSSERPCL